MFLQCLLLLFHQFPKQLISILNQLLILIQLVLDCDYIFLQHPIFLTKDIFLLVNLLYHHEEVVLLLLVFPLILVMYYQNICLLDLFCISYLRIYHLNLHNPRLRFLIGKLLVIHMGDHIIYTIYNFSYHLDDFFFC